MNDATAPAQASSGGAPHETAPDTTLDAAISRALDRQPAVRVPEGFAARVAGHATAQRVPRRSRWLGWGPRLMVGSAAVLTASMFALAPHAAPSVRNPAFDAELLLLAELGALLLFSPRLLSRD
jgi:hypothetical protein